MRKLLKVGLYALTLNLFVASVFAHEWIYTVRPGDSLWNLAEKHLLNVGYTPHLQKLNDIQDPENLIPGTRIKFPISWLKTQPEKALIVFASGTGKVIAGEEKSEKTLVEGLELETHDIVMVEQGGNVIIEFADGSRLTVRENSSVEMDTLSAYGVTGMVDTRVRLTEGRVKANAAPARGPASRYEIQTRAAVTAVRGTEFRVNAFGEVGRTEVLEGTVGVAGSGIAAREQAVPAGFGVVAKVGEPPERPRELLARPDISNLPEVVEKDPAAFNWSDQPGAKSFRVQVAASDDFNDLLLDSVTNEAKISRVEFGQDGDYFMRLRAIDEVNLEGLDALHAFTVNARPTAPLTVEPKPEALLRDAQPPLVWTESHDIAGYQLQLSTSEDFSSTLVDVSISNPQITESKPHDPLLPGTYYWRVAARTKDGGLGPFGDARAFTYTPPPPTPELSPPEISEEGMVLYLPRLGERQELIVQVAKDIDFTKMVADEQLADSKFTLKPKKGGRHYIRTAIVEPDGYVGEYSNIQEVKIPRKWPEYLAKVLISIGFLFGF